MVTFKKIVFLVLTLCISCFFFSCQDDTDDEQNSDNNANNPCQENCFETKQVIIRPTGDTSLVILNEYVRVAGKRLTSLVTFIRYPSKGESFTRYEYNSSGDITRSVQTTRKNDGTLVTNDDREYLYEAGRLVRHNDYDAGSLSQYAIYEYTEGVENYTKRTFYSMNSGTTEFLIDFYAIFEYDNRNNLTKSSIYRADGSLSSYTTYEYDSNNNQIKAQLINSEGLVLQEASRVYQDCLVLREEQIFQGGNKDIRINTIEDGKIVSQEQTNDAGQVIERITYEQDCE